VSLDALLAELSAPLAPARQEAVQRAYLARSITELLHERLITADVQLLPGGRSELRLPTDVAEVGWSCEAVHRQLDHWHVFPETIRRHPGGPPSAAQLFVDLRATIGIPPFTLARFVEETAQTLYADACIAARGRRSAAELAHADHQTLEAAMEGHPWILVNKGRLGFGALEQQTMTPEGGAEQQLVWLAARRDLARVYTLPGLDYQELLARELGDELPELEDRLRARGLEPRDYLLLPAHAWQVQNRLLAGFGDEIASRRLVVLAASRARYRAQQSIRTFRHAADGSRLYVKTALSILNTGQIRGLAPEKLRRAPAVTAWLQARFAGDPVLRQTAVLGEIATVVVEHPIYRQLADAPYQYREQLGALFRESPEASLQSGESLATMASLLYVDDEGRPLIAAFADRAAVTLERWLAAYLRAYLVPLLHCMFHHETFFVAHGENTLLVLHDGLPTRVVLKDLVEEIQVSRQVRAGLPEDLASLFYELEDAWVPLFVLTDVCDGFFRYLADVLVSHAGYAEDHFWRQVSGTIRAYQAEHPELAEKFQRWNLFPAEFPRFCLNKYRLVLFGYADTAHNVLDTSPKFSGTLPNPLVHA
jgi:siderophore synthetase component